MVSVIHSKTNLASLTQTFERGKRGLRRVENVTAVISPRDKDQEDQPRRTPEITKERPIATTYCTMRGKQQSKPEH